jgi:hypothetical protein
VIFALRFFCAMPLCRSNLDASGLRPIVRVLSKATASGRTSFGLYRDGGLLGEGLSANATPIVGTVAFTIIVLGP